MTITRIGEPWKRKRKKTANERDHIQKQLAKLKKIKRKR